MFNRLFKTFVTLCIIPISFWLFINNADDNTPGLIFLALVIAALAYSIIDCVFYIRNKALALKKVDFSFAELENVLSKEEYIIKQFRCADKTFTYYYTYYITEYGKDSLIDEYREKYYNLIDTHSLLDEV